MSAYDNETKTYPDLKPTLPQEPILSLSQIVRNCGIFSQWNWNSWKNYQKSKNQFNTITGIVHTDLITSTVITGGISITVFASGVGLPVAICLSGANLHLSPATAILWKSFKIFTVKQEKHDSIKLLAQTKLDSMSNIISQAMQDGDTSPTEFHKVLQEVEKIVSLRLILGTKPRLK